MSSPSPSSAITPSPPLTNAGQSIWRSFSSGKARGFTVIIGAVLVQITVGTLYTVGNLSPYMISYLRQHNAPHLTNDHIVWINALLTGGQGVFMPISGVVERRLGPRITALIGSSILSSGIALTYFTIQSSYPLVLLTYGVMFGVGVGVAYVPVLTVGLRWFPHNRGVVTGVIIASIGVGSLVFNMVETGFLNPGNIPPEKNGYFTDKDVLNRVPSVFLLLAGTYAILQIIGCLLMANPSKELTRSGTDDSTLTVRQALRTKKFYLLWFTFLLNCQSVTYFSSMYKAYGQTFIKDDHFLAVVGAIGSISNAASRLIWGFLVDRFQYKKCMLFVCVHTMVFMLTLQLTKDWGKGEFALWTALLFFGVVGSFVLIPTCCSHTFGTKNTGVLYGLIFASSIVGGPTTALTTQYLSPLIGFSGMFYVMAGCSFISLVLTLIFKPGVSASQ